MNETFSQIMTTFALSPRSVSLVAVSVGSILLSVIIASMFVSYNPPGLSVTINEYFINGNRTENITKWQRISEQGQEVMEGVKNADNSFGFTTEFGKNGSEIGSDEVQEIEKANNSVITEPNLLISDGEVIGISIKNGSEMVTDGDSHEMPPNLFVDEVQEIEKANNSVITEPNLLISDGEVIGISTKNGSEMVTDGDSHELPPNLFVDEVQEIEKANNSANTESNRLVSDGKVVDDSTKDDGVNSLNLSVPVAAALPSTSRNKHNSTLGSCDLYHGKWIYDPTGPLYTNSTCPILTQTQNCQGNGRPDKNYENWRWKPSQCELPRFDGRKFLQLMKGKTLAFVGDSLARNQMESLLCILWQIEVPIRGGNRFMHKWYFRSTSTTIARIWSAWLVHKDPLPIPTSSPRAVKVLVDTPDETLMNFLPNFDVVILSSGHWFSNEPTYILNGTIIRRQLRRRKRSRNKQKTDIIKPYSIAIQTVLNAIVDLPNYSGLVIFRSYSPGHYMQGAWNTGGSCAGYDGPSSESLRNGHAIAMAKKQVELVEGAAKRVKNGSKLRFMDISEVSGYRQDGHPGPYGTRGGGGQKGPQDCVHWCMPGAVDTWNEILFEILQREI